jgi:hypothetical protein
MIPFCAANAILTTFVGGNAKPEHLNEDYAFYLKNAPTPSPDPWAWRLLPAFLRKRLKAGIEARKYEQTLIAMWENSPHLLDDIGVVLSADSDIPEHLVAAPARVIEHVKASTAEKAAAISVQPEPEPISPVRTGKVRARASKVAVPGGLPA